MYFQNVGYRWSCIESCVHGVVFGACHQTIEQALRRHAPVLPEHVLFDPQLYALGYDLTPQEFGGLLTNLATYPWFGMAASEYESGAESQRDWKGAIADGIDNIWENRADPCASWPETVESCVRFQEKIGATKVILPATLVADPESSLDEDFCRLDEAVAVARTLTDKPILASLPVEEGAIRHRAFVENTLVEAIVDQVSARGNIDGIYIPVASAGAKDRLSSLNAVGAVLRMVRLLRACSDLEVHVNYVESLGLVALSLGATAYASGYGLKQKRFCINDFRRGGGGLPLPKFLSLSLLVDLYPERDLERLRDARLLHLIKNDWTPSSDPLCQALSRGLGAAAVPAWEERRNNTASALTHYQQAHRARLAVGSLGSEDILAWLQSAEASALYVAERFQDDPLSCDRAHITPWRRALEENLQG
jgi:hypothetical protein